MMFRKKPDVDIVKDILESVLEARPASEFVRSLMHQYEERGGLSKKQLEGLYKKAQRISSIPAARLATLEAMIRQRPNRYKSPLPENKPLYEKDEKAGEMISFVLEKFPAHKRVLFFKAKFDNNEPLQPAELTELEKFYRMFQK